MPEAASNPGAATSDAAQAAGFVRLRAVWGDGPATGLSIRGPQGDVVLLDEQGAATLALPVGDSPLVLLIPAGRTAPGAAAQELNLGQVSVAPNTSSEMNVSLSEQGELLGVTVTPQAPPAAEASAEVPSAAEEEASVGTAGPVLITGQVVDRESGAALAGASVFALGSDLETTSDAQGRFSLKVPAGAVSLAVVHPEYPTEAVIDLRVGRVSPPLFKVQLTRSTEVDDLVVIGRPIEGGVASVLAKRRESASVTDALGSAEISRSTDGSAGAATRRIVGASIVGGQFLFVRGLGGRYTNSRLNGVPLPSTDPDLPGFQLDLFPTNLIAGLTITKTFTPDIPGDFAGGSLNVETRTYPDKFTVKASIGVNYDTQSTFRKMPDYGGGKRDILGYDDGTRQLPGEFPEELVRGQSIGSEAGFTRDERTEISRMLPNRWRLGSQTALPGSSLALSVGDVFKVGGGKLGYLATGAYKYKQELTHETLSSPRLEDGQVTARQTLERDVAKSEALIGALGTVTYEPTKDNKFTIISLLTQNGTDQTSVASGRSESEGTNIQQTMYRWVDRQLFFNQLLGAHDAVFGKLDIDWQLNLSQTERNQPDTRQTYYIEGPNGFEYNSAVGGGEHLYTTLSQDDIGGGLDLGIPWASFVSTKVGYLGQLSDRRFAARRFGSDLNTNNLEAEQRLLPPEQLLSQENAGELWTLNELTIADTDGFEAEQDLHAVYALAELSPFKRLKATGGVRLESARQLIEAKSPVLLEEEQTERTFERARRVNKDLLPAAGLVFTLMEDMYLRAAYGGTVARPLVRELSPFQSRDFVRRRSTSGNPDLKRTYIQNFDLRWEMFPSTTEVLAVSAFYKTFKDPIETVIKDPDGSNLGYQNISKAYNYGLELEARARLDVLNKSLEAFTTMANLALIRSEVNLSEEEGRNATSQDRPLAGQSPYVLNLGLGFEPAETGFSTFVYYNVFGRRIIEVGTSDLPDVYEEPFHSLDWTAYYEFTKNFSGSLSASNLLLQESVFTQGPLEQSRSQKGLTLSAGAGFSY